MTDAPITNRTFPVIIWDDLPGYLSPYGRYRQRELLNRWWHGYLLLPVLTSVPFLPIKDA